MLKFLFFKRPLSIKGKLEMKKQQLLALRDKTGFILKLVPKVSFPRMNLPLALDGNW